MTRLCMGSVSTKIRLKTHCHSCWCFSDTRGWIHQKTTPKPMSMSIILNTKTEQFRLSGPRADLKKTFSQEQNFTLFGWDSIVTWNVWLIFQDLNLKGASMLFGQFSNTQLEKLDREGAVSLNPSNPPLLLTKQFSARPFCQLNFSSLDPPLKLLTILYEVNRLMTRVNPVRSSRTASYCALITLITLILSCTVIPSIIYITLRKNTTEGWTARSLMLTLDFF